MGKLLGDPEVWDDSVARPRVAMRGGAALLGGLAIGALVGLLATSRPAPPPPSVVVPSTQAVPTVPVDRSTLANVSLASGRPPDRPTAGSPDRRTAQPADRRDRDAWR